MFTRCCILVGFIVMLIPVSAMACDVCGCSISGQNIGILPKFNHHFIGLRSSLQSFNSYHPPLLSSDIPKQSREIFYSGEIWSRVQVANRWQVFGFVPFSHIIKKEDTKSFQNQGLGDVSILAMYSVFQNRVSSSGRYIQTLQLGSGIKMPTGTTDFTAENEWIASLQNGTGTWDFFVNANYIGRWQETGFQVDISYRKNTEHAAREFRFGDRLSGSTRFFHTRQVKKATIMPLAGFAFEYAGQNMHEGIRNELSGGYSINATAGIEFFVNQYGLGIHGTLPVKQSMSNGYLTSDGRVHAHISYFF